MKKKTNDAVKILKDYIKKDPELEASVMEELGKLRLADKIREARKHYGLTQQQLADEIGTTQSVISRLESGDYSGYTIQTLVKLGRALGGSWDLQHIPWSSAEKLSQETQP